MFRCKILRFDKVILDESVSSVHLPGLVARLNILENHAPLVSVLCEGVVLIKSEKPEKKYLLKSGMAVMRHNELLILEN